MAKGKSKLAGTRAGGSAVNVDDKEALKKAYINVNPNFSNNKYEYTHNCNKCVVAFEANMRGDDVEALPYKMGIDSEFSRHIEKAFGLKKSDGWQVGREGNKKQTVQNIEQEMNDYGVGSRGFISFYYKGGRAGHVFNIVQTSKGTRAIDAQKGKEMTIGQALNGAQLGSVTLYRVDNKKIDRSMAQNAYKKRGKGNG